MSSIRSKASKVELEAGSVKSKTGFNVALALVRDDEYGEMVRGANARAAGEERRRSSIMFFRLLVVMVVAKDLFASAKDTAQPGWRAPSVGSLCYLD